MYQLPEFTFVAQRQPTGDSPGAAGGRTSLHNGASLIAHIHSMAACEPQSTCYIIPPRGLESSTPQQCSTPGHPIPAGYRIYTASAVYDMFLHPCRDSGYLLNWILRAKRPMKMFFDCASTRKPLRSRLTIFTFWTRWLSSYPSMAILACGSPM